MSDADRLQKFYLAYYGRPADPMGLNYWLSQMAGRLKNQDVALAAALGSTDQAEFRALYGNLPSVSALRLPSTKICSDGWRKVPELSTGKAATMTPFASATHPTR